MKQLKLAVVFTLAVAVAFSSAACSKTVRQPETAVSSETALQSKKELPETTLAQKTDTLAEAGTNTVFDMSGDAVEIKTGQIKIMTCNAVSTMTVLMLGGTDAVATLGQGFVYEDNSLNKKMFPGLERIPTFTRDTVNPETVLSM